MENPVSGTGERHSQDNVVEQLPRFRRGLLLKERAGATGDLAEPRAFVDVLTDRALVLTVTAFLYDVLAARPYRNSSILSPQFLASAFCSGSAILLIVLQLLRRFTGIEIQDQAMQAIWRLPR